MQLRDKQSDTRVMIERARAIKAALAPFRVPLVINDRVDVALAMQAPTACMSGRPTCRSRMRGGCSGRDAIIGLSIKSVALAEAAPIGLLDYVGVGGVYATTSKDNPNPPIGARWPRAHRRRCSAAARRTFRSARSPGSTPATRPPRSAPARDGVAVISALSLARDPLAAARELRAIVDAALAERVEA